MKLKPGDLVITKHQVSVDAFPVGTVPQTGRPNMHKGVICAVIDVRSIDECNRAEYDIVKDIDDVMIVSVNGDVGWVFSSTLRKL